MDKYSRAGKVWDDIIYRFTNFNGCPCWIWEWIKFNPIKLVKEPRDVKERFELPRKFQVQYFDGLMPDCSISSALAMEILQSGT